MREYRGPITPEAGNETSRPVYTPSSKPVAPDTTADINTLCRLLGCITFVKIAYEPQTVDGSGVDRHPNASFNHSIYKESNNYSECSAISTSALEGQELVLDLLLSIAQLPTYSSLTASFTLRLTPLLSRADFLLISKI
jgi:hypothetical protein